MVTYDNGSLTCDFECGSSAHFVLSVFLQQLDVVPQHLIGGHLITQRTAQVHESQCHHVSHTP